MHSGGVKVRLLSANIIMLTKQPSTLWQEYLEVALKKQDQDLLWKRSLLLEPRKLAKLS